MTTDTQIDEPTVEAVAEEFVKDHNSTEIVEELVKYSNSVDSLERQLESSKERNAKLNQQLGYVKAFILEHVKNDELATVSELKELAAELDITLTKEVTVQITVEYNLTVECALDEEVSEDDISIDLSYNGVGELTNEDCEWSNITIEDE
jgi:hypothetical protein